MIIKIHRFLGIVLVFFVLILSVTGTLLQHAEDFKIRQTYASSTFAKNVYGIKPCVISSAPISSKWISICNNNLYFEEKRIVNNITTLRAAYKKNDNYVILYDGHIITVSSSGEIIDLGHTETPKNVKISLKENILPGNLKKIIEDKSISKTITYERVIVDLHSGRLFGTFGVTLVDLVTLGLIILSITGTYSWLRYKKFF